ncbi:hypothetical protein [Acetitomaculum ruminis]|uniref:hypothetical protein n=1 Tax=Acetitomaculum ruminis TaxID=2382 RepID=UPI000B82943E|nr:hypothetical protein [Acetitomaculum ruminis]
MKKIEQVTDTTLVICVDVGSQLHYARAFDNRGKELTKRVLSFQNSIEGFNTFNQWEEKIRMENDKTEVMIGCEPTGLHITMHIFFLACRRKYQRGWIKKEN